MIERSVEDEIIEILLKESGESSPKQQPKFKVGDVVENEAGLRGIITTTEKAEALIKADSYLSRTAAERFGRDNAYVIQWFNGEQHTGFISEEDLELCKGVQDLWLCDKCQDRFECWTNREK